MSNLFFYNTPLGKIAIAEKECMISKLFFEKEIPPTENCTVIETPLLAEAGRQLNEYFQGKRREFSLPLLLAGTEFRNSVWRALCSIPYGETRSYREIAQMIGNPRASRAVGQANNKNPIPIFIPCHRVIGSDGRLVGYEGGLEIKQFLLDVEHYRHFRS